MNITKIDLCVLDDNMREELKLNRHTLAIASIVFEYDIAIHKILLCNGEGGPYLLFPKDKVGKGIVYPINNETRQNILECLLKAYENRED